MASAAKRCGIALKQTFAKEGRELRRKAGGYAHAKQFKRLRRTVQRQRTMLGALMRDAQRGLQAISQGAAGFNIRWLLRAIAAKGLAALLLVFSHVASYAASIANVLQLAPRSVEQPDRRFGSPRHQHLLIVTAGCA